MSIWPNIGYSIWPADAPAADNTFDLHVTNASGDNINGATVLLETSLGVEIFNISTDANGVIVQQTVATQTDTVLTITKAGYNVYIAELDIDRDLDLEIALGTGGGSGGGGGARFRNIGIGVNIQ